MLMLERKQLTDDLNVGRGERMRALLAITLWTAALGAALRLFSPWWMLAMLAVTLVGNGALVAFFAARRGAWFACRAFMYHQFYYLYSSAAFATAVVQRALYRARGRRGATY